MNKIKMYRKKILQGIDRDELESLDQTVELYASLFAITLGMLILILSYFQFSPVIVIMESINIIITLLIWTGYKLARTKLAIDLRFWVIVEGITITYFIVFQLLFTITIEFFTEQSLLQGALILLFVGMTYFSDEIRPRARRLVEKRWNQMNPIVSNESEGDLIDTRVLYLVQHGRLDTMAYVGMGAAFAIIATAGLHPSTLVPLLLYAFVMLSIVFGYMFYKMKKLQRKVWFE